MTKHAHGERQAREQELTAAISQSRDALMQTLQELQAQAQPSTQAMYLKDNLVHKAQEAQVAALNTIDEAREGDREALKKVLIAVGSGIGVIAFVVLRHKLKRRRRCK